MRLMIRVLGCVCVCAIAASASAQTKFAGKCSQGKPDPNYTVPVGDNASHALVLGKAKCVWSAGEIEGIQLKEEDDTVVSDVSGNTSRDRGYGVGTAANGDKYFVRFEGTTAMKNNAPSAGKCNWTFTGGTGKFKGLTGKGTCSGTFDASGAAVFDVQGEYQIAAATKK